MSTRMSSFALLAALAAATPALSNAPKETSAVSRTAQGPFEVQVIPQPRDASQSDVSIDRLLLEKRYRGALDATSRGQMIAAHGVVETSGAYVAIERVDGTLDGRRGAFALQHSGTMTKADGYAMHVTVVPDSGTGELAGIAGRMTIRIAPGGAHSYEFAYTLPGG